MKKLLNERIFILGTLVVALLIRLYKINLQDIWRDEAFSVNASMQSVERIFQIAANDTQPPLHMLTMHFFGEIFGYSEFAVRFISLIFGIIAVFFTFLIAKKVFGKEKDLVYFVTLVATFSPLLVSYSQEARPYSMLLAFFTISFYYFLKIINKEYKSLDLVLFVAASLLGLYTQNIFVIVILAFGPIWLGKSYKRISQIAEKDIFSDSHINKMLSAFIFIGLLYLPWLLIFIKQYSKISAEGFWLTFEPIKNISESLTAFFVGHTGNANYGNLDGFFALTVFVVGISSFFVGLYSELRELDPEIKSRNHKIYLSFYIFVILGLIFLVSFKTPFFYIRYIMFVAPLIFLLSAKGFRSGLRIDALKELTNFIMFLFLISLAGFQVLNNAINDVKPHFEAATQTVDINYVAGDLVLVPNAISFHAAEYYSILLETEFKFQIYNPENDLVYYEGLASLRDSDYYRGNFEGVSRVWLLELSESTVSDHLSNALFVNTNNFHIKGVQMSLWERYSVQPL